MKIIVIGGGPAGMMAAGTASETGNNVILIDKNKSVGRKLVLTGKGRCNITNACDDIQTLISNIPINGRFLYSAFRNFDNHMLMHFFEQLGVKLKVERGNRVFPESDSSFDVVDALRRYCGKAIQGNVKRINVVDSVVVGVTLENGEVYTADKVILATGGMSYPGTGSTGDGYKMASELGHTITELKPSLAPIETNEEWPADLQGLALRNIALTIKDDDGKRIFSDFGELMFTHFGLSGPVILSASSHLKPNNKNTTIHIDLKPAISSDMLNKRILSDFTKYKNRDFCNSLQDLLPHKLIPVVIKLSGIDPHKKVNAITKLERMKLHELLKDLTLTFKRFRPIEEAIITSGGICVKEIDPSTMQSKIINGLYFAGEIIDTDGYTGGFNLQIAFSTGRLAGMLKA